MPNPFQTQSPAEALAKLERALLTPVVSGKLKAWVGAVQQTADSLAAAWREHLQRDQRRQYGQIAGDDAELLTTVQRLAEEDRRIVSELDLFLANLAKLAKMAAVAGRHESRPEDQRADVERQGHELIRRIRRQEGATETWLSESLYRDRGVSPD
jgi:hypothetical protein